MKHIHLIGIGGTGISAIARVLLESGYTVSGSDRNTSLLAESLREAGARIYTGHRPENVHGAELVVRSSAIHDNNPEVQEARRLGIPVLKRVDFLQELIGGKACIAIAGSHGKTTTTAMIAWLLTALNQDPSYIIGGVSLNLGNNAHAGKGSSFVIEADEYDYMFWGLKPTLAVVTSIEHDHPDCYPTPEDFYQAFVGFIDRLDVGGTLVLCKDDPGAVRLHHEAQARGIPVVTYGILSSPCDFSAEQLALNKDGCYSFKVRYPGNVPAQNIMLEVPGKHNIANSLAALAVAHQLGLPARQAAEALAKYCGTGRRFEVRGEAKGVHVIDDYAHHPAHIRATLAAARSKYPGHSIWAVWQPHTYSRTQLLLADYAVAFDDADHVLITEVYPARESAPVDGFTAEQVLTLMHHPDAHFIASLSEAAQYLITHLQPGAVLLVLSAGDADQISAQVLADLTRV